MKPLKKHQFLISIAVGIILFVVTYPFYHDMYIAELFTAICIVLNAFSCVLFGIFLYQKLTKQLDKDDRITFIWFTLMQAIGHCLFATMNWGSFLFLALSVVVILLIVLSFVQKE